MGSLRLIKPLFFILAAAHFIFPTTSQPDFLFRTCSNNSNYTKNSTFSKNLSNVLLSISSNTRFNNYSFYNATSGHNPDRATALALCRGGVPLEQCRSCVYNSTLRITQDCPYQKEAAGWYQDCQIRYSNNSIYGMEDSSPQVFFWNLRTADDPVGFNDALWNLLDGLRKEAALGSSVLKSAWGGEKIRSPRNNDNTGRTKTIVIITVTVVSVAILLVAIFIILILRKQNHKRPSDNFEDISYEDTENEISSMEMIQFDFDSIKAATDDFAIENKLGQGGFGVVYKGQLPNGQLIAVKRLANNSQQGDVEFKNEVLLMLKLQHRNLVRLMGFCSQQTERILIYEFVENGSLDHFLFDFEKRRLLDWETRYKIINGIARGLLYLHEDSRLRIVHRDLKASNILLDIDMNSKISDFGMARLFEVDQTRGNTSRIVGTYGYMAPEYVIHGLFSVKSDVFSFGVLVLETVSGRKNSNFCSGETSEDLSSFAWTNWRAGTISNVIDSTLTSGLRFEMIRCIHIGLLCVQENIANRPTMTSVVMMLSSASLTLPIPSKPAFFMHTTTNRYDTTLRSDESNSESVSDQYSRNNISITEIHPR